MTLTLSTEIENALTTAAARQGTTPDALVAEMVKESLPLTQEAYEEQKSRIQAITESMAHLGPSRLAGDNAEEIAQEEAELGEKISAARGMYSHISGGSYEFIRNKVYEKLLEERHW